MAKRKIRVGLIGCGGNMRRAHLPRFRADGGVNLVCVADPDQEAAEALIQDWGGDVAHYEDYRQLIRNEDLEAVVISSPHALHYEHARLVLQKGLHVLIEKPLTISSRQSKTLIGLSDKHKKLMVVSYQRNFMAPHTYARELIRSGEIGDLRGVVAYVTQNWGSARGWRLDPEMSGGGMFMDTGSHLVASVLWITGLEPVEVSAYMDNAGKQVDINAVVNVRFKGGASGTLNTFGNAGCHDERIAIHGSKGCIVFHLHRWQVKSVLVNDRPMKVPARIKERTPDEAFFGMIRNGGKGYEPADFALQVARLSEAAYRSVAGKKPVKVAR
ncbi:MAG: Gfo/Idh/MocA family oxidoreductase [bacterium]|nr:Gfo/Idh/MocA family oxidoreductase [bacterium]